MNQKTTFIEFKDILISKSWVNLFKYLRKVSLSNRIVKLLKNIFWIFLNYIPIPAIKSLQRKNDLKRMELTFKYEKVLQFYYFSTC